MRILLFGDGLGMPELLRHVPPAHVCGLVRAANRPQYHDALDQLAASTNLPLAIQPLPASPDYPHFREWVETLAPDLIWVNSYSMVVRADILRIPRLGGINIHGALLPQYRGCNPTQWAILRGEMVTGVTLHEMTPGLDEGAIIDQKRVPLYFEDTWRSAQARIGEATDRLIAENLPSILSGCWQAHPQDEARAQYHPRRHPEDGRFQWNQPVYEIYNLVRALVAPHPGTFSEDETNGRTVIDSYRTPAALAAMKHAHMGETYLRGGQVRLRPPRREDSELLCEWIADREQFIVNAPLPPISQEEHGTWTDSLLGHRTDLVSFVIEDITTRRALGTCHLLNINWVHRSAELQIRGSGMESQNHGWWAEAIDLLAGFGFDDLNLHRIYVHILASDERAIHTYEECGFICEGASREAACIYGDYVEVANLGRIGRKHG